MANESAAAGANAQDGCGASASTGAGGPGGSGAADPSAGCYARFYDFLVDHTEEVPHLLRLAGKAAATRGRAGARILECGPGTGRLAVPLAQAGHEVLGLERSPSMLVRAVARRNAATDRHGSPLCEARCRFVEADFTAAPAEQVAPAAFDLVVFSSNTLALIPAESRQHAALRQAFRALRPGGYLVLEQLHPAGFFAEAFRQREWLHQFTRRNPETGLLTSRSITFVHDALEQQIWATTLLEEFLPEEPKDSEEPLPEAPDKLGNSNGERDADDASVAGASLGGHSRRHMFVEQLRYHHVAELRLRLATVGFAPRRLALFGSHECTPLTVRSLKLIAVAQKSPSE